MATCEGCSVHCVLGIAVGDTERILPAGLDAGPEVYTKTLPSPGRAKPRNCQSLNLSPHEVRDTRVDLLTLLV